MPSPRITRRYEAASKYAELTGGSLDTLQLIPPERDGLSRDRAFGLLRLAQDRVLTGVARQRYVHTRRGDPVEIDAAPGLGIVVDGRGLGIARGLEQVVDDPLIGLPRIRTSRKISKSPSIFVTGAAWASSGKFQRKPLARAPSSA